MRRAGAAVAVGGDQVGMTAVDELPGARLDLRTVIADDARRVDLEEPAALVEGRGDSGILCDGPRTLRMRDDRRAACGLDVLREALSEVERAVEGDFHEHRGGTAERVAGRILVEKRRSRGQLEAELQIEAEGRRFRGHLSMDS